MFIIFFTEPTILDILKKYVFVVNRGMAELYTLKVDLQA